MCLFVCLIGETEMDDSDSITDTTMEQICKEVEKGANYYEFQYNTRLVKPTILHFQLRNVVWATSKHDVYLMSNYAIVHWSPLSGNSMEVVNFSGNVAPTEKHPGSLLEGFTQTQISTLAVKDKWLVAGGFQGELICKHISMSPDCKLIAVVGDHLDGLLVDSQNGKIVSSLVGHLDYSFASDGIQMAASSRQEIKTRHAEFGILETYGQFMAVAEPADFVHIYSANGDYSKWQEIDLFGEISGISLSPDNESLFIGVWDRTYASLLQYHRKESY
ncbi:hypothetical protein MKX01_015424 [Papaver californicum]|nr:hypothetical protein MKX01_015424 [Papaver californicum]